MRPEDALQREVCKYLTETLPLASWWCAVPNGAVLAGGKAKRSRQMNSLKSSGLRLGAPDLIVLHDGRFLSIELKAAKGKISENQAIACDQIIAAGGGYTISRSVEDVERYLLEHDVPLQKRVSACAD